MSKLAIGEDKHNLLNVFTLWAYYGEAVIYQSKIAESGLLNFYSNISLLTYNHHKYIE